MSLRSSYPQGRHGHHLFILLLYSNLILYLLSLFFSQVHASSSASVRFHLKTVAGIAQSQGYTELYISDSANYRIRKVNLNTGIMTSVVGDGTPGFVGENSMATKSKINHSIGLFWSNGWLYIADTNNHRIRVVNNVGAISTLVGTGVKGYNGEWTVPSNTQTEYPVSVHIHGNDVYYSENGRIRKIVNGLSTASSNSAYVLTLAGNGTNGYNGDDIPATSALVNAPHGIFVTSNGEVLFADRLNHRIRKITTDAKMVTIAGTGSPSYNGNGLLATNTNLNSPEGVLMLDNNEILVADTGNHCIRKISTDGVMKIIAGVCGNAGYNGDDIFDGMTGFLNLPTSLTFSKNSGIYVSESNNHIIRRLVPYCDSGYILSSDLLSCVENKTCFGILAESGTACSSKGFCTGQDSCSCYSGWFGQTCAYNYQCSGIAPDNATVCNRRGRLSTTTSSPSSTWNAIIIAVVVGVIVCLVATCICAISLCVICRIKKSRNRRGRRRFGHEERNEHMERKPSIADEDPPQLILGTNVKTNDQDIEANHVVVTFHSTPSGMTPNSSPPTTTTSSYLPLQSGSYTPSTTIESYSLYVPSEVGNTDSQQQHSITTGHSLTVMASNQGYDKFTSKDHTYRVVKLLGKGGFGSCYLCENIQTLEQIAVKVVQATDDNYASICSEFSKCLAFQHPRLVKSIEYLAGVDRNSICLAMKYYRYGDLEHVVKNVMNASPPSDAILISLINQIGEGLQYLHDVQRVIHRDIKPKNIMVDEFDEFNHSIQVVIGDFGVSKQANAAHTYAGTFYYVSPEIYLGKACTFATDIFSLGVMLYAVITGEMNCEHVSITQRLLDVGEKAYEEIENKVNGKQVNPEIVNLVMRMLARDPEKRPLAKELVDFNIFQSV
ncbi:hypothetical protein C9374_004148 [Naegleria lovaniensis]|uniref:mitogen-activated protein kinase kinase n=1 Tax=Naegleria lovaniensis TaxID=51637 RepID=A0AA88KJQ3_NAELO|nr:uncharacterized protein C9374_004148 [Naegleria lovaniensis]KAG2383477.1 hypothetical protein C9374_004148 [Naegleria lovaniensis]